MGLGKLSRADSTLIFTVMGSCYNALELAAVDVANVNHFSSSEHTYRLSFVAICCDHHPFSLHFAARKV